MCTVTWLDDPAGGYALLFNRDERRTRSAAAPPSVARHDGVPYLAPTDGDAGGTWLGVNALGVTVGLLNHYAADDARAHRAGDMASARSRGQLVRSVMACASVADVAARLAAEDLAASYRPCEVLAFDAAGGRLRATWDGRRLVVAHGPAVRPPISSSCFATADVLAVRAATYDATVGPDPAARRPTDAVRLDGPPRLARLEAYQRSHVPERGAFSVCMHRDDAETVSLTVLGVEHDRVWMRYGAGPACTAVLGPTAALDRIRAAP